MPRSPSIDPRRDGLLTLLAAVEDRPDTIAAMLALAWVPNPFDRTRSTPGHFTASGFVLAPDGDAVLLVDHRRLGRWLQPGGHVDPGDATPEAAARREIAEETGISSLRSLHEGLFDVDVHPIPPRADEPAHHHFDLRFAYRATTRALVTAAEVRDARWVDLADLDAVRTDDSVRRPARRLAALAAALPRDPDRLQGPGSRE